MQNMLHKGISCSINKISLAKNGVVKRPFHNWDPPGSHDFDFKVPDWKTVSIKGIKELELVERELAARGLKNPWLRNEAWRYPLWLEPPMKQLKRHFWWAFKPAFAITVSFIIMQNIYWNTIGDGKPPYVHTAWDYFHHIYKDKAGIHDDHGH